jgi:Fic family protein
MIAFLPITKDFETNSVLKKLTQAHKALAELKGIIKSIPNENILIETLTLREAKESSAVENIISTMDEVFQSSMFDNQFTSANAKEIHQYASALKMGYLLVKENGLITNNTILKVQQALEANDAGYRKQPGTKLLNDKTGEVVYMPPQDYDSINQLMQKLEKYINDDSLEDIDPLIKMAIIHHQFESIHPFYDGNGRTGRIINILYLVQKELLHLPILYMSGYIIKTKSEYYKLLQKVRETNEWEDWILYMLTSIEKTAKESIELITIIRIHMQLCKHTIKKELPKLYSQDLINNLFKYPYTKIEYIERDLGVSRKTAIRYLEKLTLLKILQKRKVGRNNFYINEQLYNALTGTSVL